MKSSKILAVAIATALATLAGCAQDDAPAPATTETPAVEAPVTETPDTTDAATTAEAGSTLPPDVVLDFPVHDVASRVRENEGGISRRVTVVEFLSGSAEETTAAVNAAMVAAGYTQVEREDAEAGAMTFRKAQVGTVHVKVDTHAADAKKANPESVGTITFNMPSGGAPVAQDDAAAAQ